MDPHIAKELLEDERTRVASLLAHLERDRSSEILGADEQGDANDAAEPLIAEQENNAVAQSLHQRLDAISRAQARLANGTYGLSVRSGRAIRDERLRADPAAELTIDEANEG